MKTDVLIIGCGVSGLFAALNLPKTKQIVIITKDAAEHSDSFLAQGGICTMRDDNDYTDFFNDTLKAGHYENRKESVDIMINSSREIISDLVSYGVEFTTCNGKFVYTKEGAHSKPRILYHEDQTGKEITSKLLSAVKKCSNIKLIENFTMVDIIENGNECFGIVGKNNLNEYTEIFADYTILATGGIGGLFENSTNFAHLTGDGLAVSLKHSVKLKNISYIQIHPTTLYSKQKGRRFLISESVRGEGAVLLNAKGERFVNELLPRDIVADTIFKEMEKEGSKYVWLSLKNIGEQKIKTHFPTIYKKCLEEGFDVTKESIPVVPAQHYFMGGIDVNKNSKTSMQRLYAVGETACNGVHGKNRLASNSLLESLVFAKRAAKDIELTYTCANFTGEIRLNTEGYADCEEKYKTAVLKAIEEDKNYE